MGDTGGGGASVDSSVSGAKAAEDSSVVPDSNGGSVKVYANGVANKSTEPYNYGRS